MPATAQIYWFHFFIYSNSHQKNTIRLIVLINLFFDDFCFRRIIHQLQTAVQGKDLHI